MCVVCGCSEGSITTHEHVNVHEHADLRYGESPARVSVPGMSQERAIQIEQSVLGANSRYAAQNRARFRAHGVLALNFVSSPGSGKTTLLVETLRHLRERLPSIGLAVIEGDQQTSLDADRIRATGVPAIQINTGKGCHLDARMVGETFDRLPLHDTGGMLFIENVGNLVCPALWDLGEAAKVAVLSVTEGDDKPLKYPDMFAAASLMILNKIDLLPYVRFDAERAIAYARRINPRIGVLQLSATTHAGLDNWLGWLEHELAHVQGQPHEHHGEHGCRHGHDHGGELEALRARVSELEAQLAARG
ncbi:MAG: hydrogenase nickel incorporation protein HypB [Pseudomonadota bacterium]